MGISSNQARFLSLTARQVDLEHRVQQICQRRLRLSSELERVATDYNNHIGNRKMFTFNTTNSGIDQLSITKIQALKDSNNFNFKVVTSTGTSNPTGVFYDAANNAFNTAKQGTDLASALAALNSSTTGCGTAYASAAEALAAGWAYDAGTFTFTYAGAANLTASALGFINGFPAGTTTAEKESLMLEAAIRNGLVVIASKSDEFTQTSYNVGGSGALGANYELRDWRTLPEIADELFKGDDMDTENKYDRIVSQINQQDKKLQLEQASVEVEYKAITSEKEAVKKILDTNATASFKYFS